MEIVDSFKIKGVGSPDLSPDGKSVAYQVTTQDFEKNSSKTRIWMQPIDGGDPIPMTAKAVSSWAPTFSRDGTKLFFLSARNSGNTQIWSLDLVHGGEAQQVTSVERGVNSIHFSRDESKLILVLKDPDDKESNSDEKSRKGKPWVVDRIQFKEDYTGYLDRRRNHIYVYDLETENLKQITSGDLSLPVTYKFTPGADDDGVTVTVPVEALGQLDSHRLAWLVPGMVEEKIVALIRMRLMKIN